MFVKRTVIINHRPSYQRGRYGLTITPLDQGHANVREIATDADLSALLLALGYPQSEVDDILTELAPDKADIKQVRSFDESKLADNGF